MDHADHAGLDVAVREEQPPNEVLKGDAKVFEMVGVEERIADRVDVREDDAELHEEVVHLAPRAEGHHAVYRVQREPADDEEDDDAGEVLHGLDLPFTRRAETTQHRPRRLVMITAQAAAETQDMETANGTAASRVHRDDLLQL